MVVEAKQVSKQFLRKREDSNVFFPVKEVDFTLVPGEVTVISGSSGSGKSTLLHMLAGILAPTDGEILVDGESLYGKGDAALSRFRNESMGVIPQAQTAINTLTVLENILLPVTMYGAKREALSQARERAGVLMERLGIQSLKNVKPTELSGGELRRMSIARALVRRPGLILADEPTSDLDEENTRLVLELLKETAGEGAAVLVITHDSQVLDYADAVYRMKDGTLEREMRKENE